MISRSSQTRISLMACTWIVLNLWSLGNGLLAKQSTAPFEDGPLQDVTAPMNKLARLKINNRNLELRRDWDQVDGEKDAQDRIDDEIKKLKARGFDGDTAARLAERIVRTATSENPFAKAFLALSSKRSGSIQRTSGQGRRSTKFQNSDLIGTALVRIPDNDVQMQIVERKSPKRELSLLQTNTGAFTFKFSGEDFLVELTQKREGGVELVRQLEEKKETYQAMDFLGLRNQHPKLVDQWLLPLMVHVGISVPMLADDSEIVNAVFAKLESYQRRAGEFGRLVKQLDSADYETRTLANEKILANRDIWKAQIEKMLESDDLSLEAKVRLQAALSIKDGDSQVDELIRDQNLLSSPEYLISLFDQADSKQKKLVVDRLQQVVGARFSKADEWKKWWQEKTDREKSKPDPSNNSSDQP